MVERKPSVLVPVATALSPWLIVFFHLCHLHSTAMEILIPVLLACAYVPIIRASRSQGKSGTVVLLGIATFLVANIYLTWLHAQSFPQVLLDKRSRETIQKIEEVKRELGARQESLSTDIETTPHASGSSPEEQH